MTDTPTVDVDALVARLRALRIMDEVNSDNPLGRDAADTLRAQADRIKMLEDALTTVADAWQETQGVPLESEAVVHLGEVIWRVSQTARAILGEKS